LYPLTTDVLATQVRSTLCAVAVTPLPAKDTAVFGLLALLTNDAFPLAAPAACGAKETLQVLLAPGAMVTGVVPLIVKAEPVTVAEETTTFAFPVLERTTFFVLVAPTVTFPKATEFGDTLSVPTGAVTPEPTSETTGAEPPALLKSKPTRSLLRPNSG